MSAAVERRHWHFTGSVQGVGFRYRAQYAAQLLDLTGWVKTTGTAQWTWKPRVPPPSWIAWCPPLPAPAIGSTLKPLPANPSPRTLPSAASACGDKHRKRRVPCPHGLARAFLFLLSAILRQYRIILSADTASEVRQMPSQKRR